MWQPIAPPLKGRYNDYGSIKDVEPGPVKNGFFQILNERAVERPVGTNTVHDVAVVRGMSEEDWLMALWEGRVQVRSPTGLTLDRIDEVYVSIDRLNMPRSWTQRKERWKRRWWRLRVKLDRYLPKKPAPILQVAQTMIREDVWQFLLAKTRRDHPDAERIIRGWELERALRMITPASDEVEEALFEIVLVQTAMMHLRLGWSEGTTIGDQFGEWSRHLEYHRELARIAEAKVAEYEDDEPEDDIPPPGEG